MFVGNISKNPPVCYLSPFYRQACLLQAGGQGEVDLSLLGHMRERKAHDYLTFLFTTTSAKKKVVTANLEFDLCVFTGNNFRYIEHPFPNGDI